MIYRANNLSFPSELFLYLGYNGSQTSYNGYGSSNGSDPTAYHCSTFGTSNNDASFQYGGGAGGVGGSPGSVATPTSPMLTACYTHPARVAVAGSTAASLIFGLSSSAHDKTNDSSS
jgi:hypothetical protein